MKNYSNIAQIAQLLILKGLKNQTPIVYKKTATSFKREYGIDLKNAPLIFVKHNTIWKLIHHNFEHRGRIVESAKYLPIVGCKDKFKSLSAEIKTVWDNFKF